jgi:phage baseplate assembly protein W
MRNLAIFVGKDATMDRGYLGTDMAYSRDFAVTADGDADLASGLACLAQDLKHALTTPRGDLWYDPTYGVDIYKYLKGENTETERLAMALDIILTIEADPRVVAGSAKAEAAKWDLHGIAFKASCQPAGESNRLNMALGYSPNAFTMEVV